MFTLVTLLIKLIRIFQKWKYKQDLNYAILVAMLRKRSYFCLKNVVPVTGLKRSHGKMLIADTNISVAKTTISASPAFHMKTSKFLQRKEWRSEISETKPARLTGFIQRNPKSVSMRKPIKPESSNHRFRLNLEQMMDLASE